MSSQTRWPPRGLSSFLVVLLWFDITCLCSQPRGRAYDCAHVLPGHTQAAFWGMTPSTLCHNVSPGPPSSPAYAQSPPVPAPAAGTLPHVTVWAQLHSRELGARTCQRCITSSDPRVKLFPPSLVSISIWGAETQGGSTSQPGRLSVRVPGSTTLFHRPTHRVVSGWCQGEGFQSPACLFGK